MRHRLLPLLACLLLATPLPAASLDELERLAQQLNGLRQQRQAEMQEWLRQQPMLQEQRERLAKTAETLARKADDLARQLHTQTAENQRLRQSLLSLDGQADALRRLLDQHAAHLEPFVASLPEHLRSPFQPLLDTLRDHDDLLQRAKAALSADVLVRKTQTALTRASVVIDGTLHRAVFIGYLYALALTPDGLRAAIGRPSPQGWHWTQLRQQTSPADGIRQLLDTLDGKRPPAIIDLPTPPPPAATQDNASTQP